MEFKWLHSKMVSKDREEGKKRDRRKGKKEEKRIKEGERGKKKTREETFDSDTQDTM